MSIKDNILRLSKYNVGFRVTNGVYVVNVDYDEDWYINPINKDGIDVIRDEVKNTFYYSTSIENDVNEIFTIINETISFNIELEKKKVLFEEKYKELQNIFLNNDYSTLEKLVFTLPKKKEKVVVKKNKKDFDKPTCTEETTEGGVDEQS